jgi:hypothetical protein
MERLAAIFGANKNSLAARPWYADKTHWRGSCVLGQV